MKRILFFIAIVNMSWQQESMEPLNETLDRLIKQENLGDIRSYKTNFTPKSKDAKKTKHQHHNHNINHPQDTGDTSQLDIMNLLHAHESKNFASVGDKLIQSDEKNIFSHSVKKDKALELNTDADKDVMLLRLLEKMMSTSTDIGKTGDPSYIPDYIDDLGNDFLQNQPEIIIDKVTYHDKNEYNDKNIENIQSAQDKEIDATVIVQELKTLLEELKKQKIAKAMIAADTERSFFPNQVSHTQNTQEYKPPCSNIPMSPCSVALLKSYPNLNTNIRSNLWRPQNMRQIDVITILRAQKLKRIQFITQLINNMISKFVYRPLYGY